jgi:bisphosphoglycerate-independent phosphoglycerate mutase (AlkP superfamily)
MKKNITIDNLAIMIQKCFTGTDSRLDKIDERFNGMDKRFDRIEKMLIADHSHRI